MKKFLKYLSFITLVASFMACNVIDNPIKEGGSNPPPTSGKVVRKVVIEDFTGHICKNCPKAAKQIKDLQAFYGENVIGIAIHAGPNNFTGVTADYPTDFKTPAGTDIYNFFNTLNALPMGMVGRVDWVSGSNTHLKTYPGWPALCATLLDTINSRAKFDIVAQSSFNTATRNVIIDVEVEALANYTNDLKIVVQLLESGIVSPQLMPDDTRDPNYVHNHVLRNTYTPSFGTVLKLAPIVFGEKLTKQITGAVSSNFNADSCHILVYVYDATNYEILQAEEISLK